jgi:DNA replication protein DnaC
MRRDWVKGFENMTFGADNGGNPTMVFARKYADGFKEMLANGVSITLSGGIGCGKTYAAASIANELLDKGYRVWMVTAPALVDAMGFETADKTRARLLRFELVVIDDLGAERGTEYAVEKIFEAVDIRQKSGLPTIITTNLDMTAPPPDLNYRRIYSRVIGFAPQFRCKGDDLRKDAGAEKRKLLLDLMRTDNADG